MVNRLLIGNHPTFGMMAGVSIPGVDVFAASKFQFMWSTMYESIQIHQSGSFTINGSQTSPTFTPFSWPDLGYLPLIIFSNDLYELLIQYGSTSSAQVRRRTPGEAGSGFEHSENVAVYYIVTRTPFPQ